MRPDDAKKGVHFHQFFYRVNPDKTIDSICALSLYDGSYSQHSRRT